MGLTPEQKARQKIDRQLELAGWVLQDYRDINISAAPGVAVREFPLNTGHADYMLYAAGKAIGVIEAKPEGHPLTDVEIQSAKYTFGLPDGLPRYHTPLPFAYESTGSVTQFTNTLQIFLPHGEPRGIRIAEITTRIVQAIQVPRTQLDRIIQRQELDHIGVYFLFGESDEQAKPLVYIGQTEDLRARLKKHHAEKEFWTTAVLLISRTDSFTLAHIRYLEWHAIKQAAAAGRYKLDNGNNGSKPFIPEPMEADVLDAFETASTLLSTLGFPVFDPVAGHAGHSTEQIVYYCTGPDCKAKGKMVEDGFVVLKGSTARIEIVSSASKSLPTKRHTLMSSGVLVKEDDVLRFSEDYLFDSPSGAALTVLGRSANGWVEWKTSDDPHVRGGEPACSGATPSNRPASSQLTNNRPSARLALPVRSTAPPAV